MFGDKLYDNIGYPTPDEIPEEIATRSLCVPASAAWLGVVMGCLMQLADEANWQQFDGGISAEDAAAAAQDIIDNAYDETCNVGSGDIPTPFWDDATDVDDEAPPETQIWYGEVDDPELPPDELTFIENAGIWAFTGFLALSGTPAAAILFHTIAPDFVLAMRGDDFAAVIDIIVDGELQAQIDTTGQAGDLIEQLVFPAASETGHDILLVLRELL